MTATPQPATPQPATPQPAIPNPALIEAEIIALTQARGPDKSICPSEVARALLPAWQSLMTPVRQAASRLALAGRIEILRKGRPVDPQGIKGVKGVIRLRTVRDAG